MKPIKEKRLTKKSQIASGAVFEPGPDNYRCQQCQLFRQTQEPFKEWVVTHSARPTIVVASAPLGIASQLWFDIRQRLFAGTGLVMNKNLLIVPPTLCMPYHHTLTAAQLQWCRPFIEYLFTQRTPTRILAMGVSAMRQVMDGESSIRSMIGRDAQWGETPLFITYDPASALKGKPEFLVSIRQHIVRMVHGLSVALPTFPGWRKVT